MIINNSELEKSVLGSLLMLAEPNELALSAIDSLTLEDFSNFQHKQIFQSIKTLMLQGRKADLITVSDTLQGDDAFVYLAYLQKETISAANIREHTRLLKDYRVGRDLQAKLTQSQEIIASHGSFADKLTAIQALMSDVETHQQSHAKHIKDVGLQWLDRYEESQLNPDKYLVTTGISKLDEIMDGGLNPTDLVVIGARPKMGKTELAAFLIEHVTLNLKRPVLMASLEMEDVQIATRLFANRAQVNKGSFRSGMNNEEYGRVSMALGSYIDSNLYIDDRPNLTLSQIRSEARRIKSTHGEIGMIVIDYLTLMKVEGVHSRNDLAVAEISKGCKNLAKELKAPVILLSQLSRGVEQRSDKHPIPADLRESGAIEQDADRIILLYRDKVYNQDSPLDNSTEIILAASRHSSTGVAWMDLTNHGFVEQDAQAMGEKVTSFNTKKYSKKAKATEAF